MPQDSYRKHMEITTGVGGSIMLALAAGLWLVYLVPSWLRRNEYLATERNALRLQQTLRIMAESAEVPAAVRAEADARSVLEQQKALKRELKQRAEIDRARATAVARLRVESIPHPEVPRRTETTARPARAVRPAVAEASVSRARTRRLRRVRAVTSLVLFAGLATGITQGVFLATTGAAAFAWAVLAFSAVAVMTSFAMLTRLAAVTRARSAAPVVATAPVARRVVMSDPLPQQVQEPAVETSWTPVPVPKPLYLGRPAAPTVVYEATSIVQGLADAAAEAERALRIEQASPEVTRIRPRETPKTAPSKFAAMGIIEASGGERPDLNEVLRRRRAAG